MSNNVKNLSIAFYWHMHQPVYQLYSDGDYLMPWVRLHGVKDYLDMLLIADNYKKLKLNFNLVPVLLDALIDYGEKGYHDIHSRLTVTPVENLSDDDKEYILNNFFDANYSSMIYPHERYNNLYQKRFALDIADINAFSEQEYSDIMAWFNLAWIDLSFKNVFPELAILLQKTENYTLQDRLDIIELHRKIIRLIVPKYKEFLEKGKIEITTSPYYHSILPILLDSKNTQKNLTTPDSDIYDLKMEDDALNQMKFALDRMENIFGKRPQGVWPSEQCISPKELKLFSDLGLKWTISDEGILSNSIDFEFVRDFKGYLEDPYFLMKSYEYKKDDTDIRMIFRDSVIPNLISFEYPNHEPKVAANDLYDRIKVIQNKLQTSPDENHLLTIAMDGENCWENYVEDGATFLNELYSLIENDETLDTVLISDYLEKEKQHRQLEKVHSGSWVNKNFQLWIGEPVKNLAWIYLKRVKEDLAKFVKANPENKNYEFAYKELLICEGSDWFWWYGEPNDSGQDHIFDYLFREHLKNVYRYMEEEIPNYLNSPLISIFTKPSRYPKNIIRPSVDGLDSSASDEEWVNAGCIGMPDGPVLQENKLVDKIYFGSDEKNFYLRLCLNNYYQDVLNQTGTIHQLYVYMKNASKKQILSPIRLINKTENIFPIMREKYHNELRLSLINGILYPAQLTKSIQGGLWVIQNARDLKVVYKNVIDICLPFDYVDVEPDENLEFFFANASFGIKESFIPQDVLLSVHRAK